MYRALILGIIVTVSLLGAARAEDGVTDTNLRVATVTVLKGPAQGLGLGMKAGMEAAFRGAKVRGRAVTLLAANDFYETEKAAEETRNMIKQNVFAMIGNVGTPTAVGSLPILKEANIPAIGFFTGAGLLRPGAGGPIVNYRASYIQETVGIIRQGLQAGIPIAQVCAFVQNDAFGMAGLAGVKVAFEQNNHDAAVVQAVDRILKLTGDNPERNNIGPVGVFTRNSIEVKPGLSSIKAWEKKSGKRCRLIVTVGPYGPIAHFVRASRQQKERWVISAVSFTGADNFLVDLKKYKTLDRVVMTQVVPLLDSSLPIVQEAKQKLGKDFGFVSLEGYIAAKMFLRIVEDTPGEITRENFMKQVKASKFDLGGIPIDFTKDGNQGSDLVVSSYVTAQGYKEVNPKVWQEMLK
jgi:ABC-type branched-subunit amino acid transport system substrate-binding protein